MSIGSTLKKVLGFVAGILIPGASAHTADLTHSIQQEVADLYGKLAADLAEKLKLDTTGMSGPDKVFAIVKALVATAERDGLKGDVQIFGAAVLDVAQAAYRASIPNIEADIVALAASLTTNPIIKTAETLVVDFLETAHVLPTPAAAPAAG